MGDIVYPPGCKPIGEDLGPDELIRRLKSLTSQLQVMGQEDSLQQIYLPLALHLADDYFIQHPSRDVQLLIACCIADVLRVFAPEAPYKDVEQVKMIFNFIVKQLNGLRDPKDPAFKRYFYLLENLAYVKSFNMCFDIEDSMDIFCSLFSLLFKIVSDEHSVKVKGFMLDVMCPLVIESDNVSMELLDIILINIVEPQKSARKNAYGLARELIKRTQETLQQYTQQFFNQVLVMDKVEKTYSISAKVYDLIYELNVITPQILLSVLPQLECKLKASQESERLKSVALLAQMFSEKDSKLAVQHQSLWRTFLARFCDIAVPIRIKCVQSSMHFLLNHPHLRKEIINTLRLRQHDTDETVRYEVVMAIVETSKRDFQVVSESEDLLEYVKERTLDKKLKIRKEAMNGLAMIYKTYLIEATVPEATRKAVVWIKDKILHGYYMSGIEDRLLVERLLITCLVPYQLPAEDRMKKLYRLLGTIDDNATKAFIELQKSQMKVRKLVSEWLKMHYVKEPSPKLSKLMASRCTSISKQLPDPLKAQEFLQKFSAHMRKDPALLMDMELILKRDVSCKECADTMATMLKKLGQPIMTNLYYNTVKMLLERIASVMVDRESIEILVILVTQCMQGGNAIQEIGMPADTVGQRGLKMLSVLSFVFSAHFQHDSILRHMLQLLSFDEEYVAPYILKAFTYLGRYRPLCDSHPAILEELAPICKTLATEGTPKQAKHALRCMFINMGSVNSSADAGDPLSSADGGGVASSSSSSAASAPEQPSGSASAQIMHIFGLIVESYKHLQPDQPHYRTALVALGHIAYNLADRFQVPIKNIVSRKIVRDLLVRDATKSPAPVSSDPDAPAANDAQRRAELRASNQPWCAEDELPEETRCKVEGLKAMARWLMGLKQDIMSAAKTFRMLNAFIRHRGDLLAVGNLAPAEMAWLRLSAGTAMLKICEQKGVGDQFLADQFYALSQLMNDPVYEVRERLVRKLHKGLSKGIPHKCLPLDFMGLYAMAGRETERTITNIVRSCIEMDVARRREYVRTVSAVEKAVNGLPHVLPDYMIVFAIAVLANDPLFTDVTNVQQLRIAERSLWLVLEPLVSNKDYFSFTFYKTMVERLKKTKNALKPDDDVLNTKLWAICDIALHLLYTKTTNYDARDFPLESRIPSMYFLIQPDDFTNTEYYLPPELYAPKTAAVKRATAAAGRKAAKSQQQSEKAASKAHAAHINLTSVQINVPDDDNNGIRGGGGDDETAGDDEEEEVHMHEEEDEEEEEEVVDEDADDDAIDESENNSMDNEANEQLQDEPIAKRSRINV